MQDCLIVGGGLSALLAADKLHAGGYSVQLIDKARSVGGRMATRRMPLDAWSDSKGDSPAAIKSAQAATKAVAIDFGAQFFTCRFPEFQAYIDAWTASGVATVWHRGQDGQHPRYRGVPDMKSIPEQLAKPLFDAGLITLEERVIEIHARASADAGSATKTGWLIRCASGAEFSGRSVLLTAPVPQCLAMLGPEANIPENARATLSGDRFAYRPCFALMLVYDSGRAAPALPAPGYANDQEHPAITGPAIRWMADNRQKGVSPDQHAITVHATADFTEAELDSDPERVRELLMQSAPILRDSQPAAWRLHRWLYSEPRRPGTARPEPGYYRVQSSPTLLLAGDLFGGGRVEGAAFSGLAAAEALKNSLNEL